ncbi:MAG: chorismate mutase [Gemmatimonadota bacterium]|nr:chorismate mutase [Gemmatimonadota bacterium]
MARLRDAVLQCDRRLIEVLARRRDLVTRIGELKKRTGLPVTDPQREAAVVRRAAVLARESGLDEELVRDLIWKVIASARTRQLISDEPAE